jgi:hypothetical protein
MLWFLVCNSLLSGHELWLWQILCPFLLLQVSCIFMQELDPLTACENLQTEQPTGIWMTKTAAIVSFGL